MKTKMVAPNHFSHTVPTPNYKKHKSRPTKQTMMAFPHTNYKNTVTTNPLQSHCLSVFKIIAMKCLHFIKAVNTYNTIVYIYNMAEHVAPPPHKF